MQILIDTGINNLMTIYKSYRETVYNKRKIKCINEFYNKKIIGCIHYYYKYINRYIQR